MSSMFCHTGNKKLTVIQGARTNFTHFNNKQKHPLLAVYVSYLCWWEARPTILGSTDFFLSPGKAAVLPFITLVDLGGAKGGLQGSELGG